MATVHRGSSWVPGSGKTKKCLSGPEIPKKAPTSTSAATRPCDDDGGGDDGGGDGDGDGNGTGGGTGGGRRDHCTQFQFSYPAIPAANTTALPKLMARQQQRRVEHAQTDHFFFVVLFSSFWVVTEVGLFWSEPLDGGHILS
jgi:hypothetical protein